MLVSIREARRFGKANSPRYPISRQTALIASCLALLAAAPLDAQARDQEQPAAPSATPAAQTSSTSSATASERGFRWKDRPTLVLGPETEIAFRARLQTHVGESEASMGDARSFDLSRRRVGIEGLIDGVVEFQVELEIDDNDPWRDVYVNVRPVDAIQVQAGKFKLPFGLEENTSAANLDFVYRSRAATQLAPGRDRGVMVHGRVLNRIVGYEAGVFDHDGRNARSSDAGITYGERTLAARLTLQPFRPRKGLWRDLQFGVAGTTSDVPEGLSGLRGRTALDAPFFEPEMWVQGQRWRTGLELRWRPGPFSVKAEYTRVTTERLEQSVEDTDLSPLVATGWYVSGTYLVTGEKKTSGPEAPRRSLPRGGWGALELAARIERLRFASLGSGEVPTLGPRTEAVTPAADRAITLGINWIPMRHLKLQANLIRETLSNPASGPLPSQSAFWSGVMRFQIAM